MRSGLNLVFDTNAFLHDAGVPLFQSLRQQLTGTLPPPVRLFIPHTVKAELHYLASRHQPKSPAATIAGAYLATIKADPAVCRQSKADAERIRHAFYPRKSGGWRAMNDGLILLYCLEVRSRYPGNVWLVSGDSQLSARSARSGIVCMGVVALRKAMELSRYTAACPDGEAYYEFHTTARLSNGSDGKLSQNSNSDGNELRNGAARGADRSANQRSGSNVADQSQPAVRQKTRSTQYEIPSVGGRRPVVKQPDSYDVTDQEILARQLRADEERQHYVILSQGHPVPVLAGGDEMDIQKAGWFARVLAMCCCQTESRVIL